MSEKHIVRIGDPAPDLALLTLKGVELRLSDYRGKRVLIFVWATWDASRDQLAAWELFYQKHRAEPFELIAVAMDAVGKDVVRSFVDQARVTFPVAIDSADCLWDLLSFDHIPNGYYVDERGVIRYLKVGGFDIRESLNAKIVDDLLSEKWSKKPLKIPERTKRSFKQEIAELAEQVKSLTRGVEKRLRLADLLVKTGQFRKAAREYDTILVQQPKNARALFAKGVVCLREGKTAPAISSWKKAFAQEPANWVIRKQIWLLQFPERFYPRIQYDWQNEQIRREEMQAAEEQKAKLKVRAQKR
jgi:tetratricopeptide (TPR) repeat protein